MYINGTITIQTMTTSHNDTMVRGDTNHNDTNQNDTNHNDTKHDHEPNTEYRKLEIKYPDCFLIIQVIAQFLLSQISQ